MKLDQAQFKELTNIIETTVKDQISSGNAGSITSITELRKTQVSLKKSIDLLTEQGKEAEADVLQKQLKTTNLQIGQMLGAQKQLSQELAENDELIEKKLLAMQEKGVELSKGAKTYLKQVEKEREKERKKTERKDESKFMRFIKAPGRALGVVNDKMGSAKEAMGSFLGKTKIGKFASLLAKPISKSLANVISKIFPYKNIVEFLLSPAGITTMLTIWTLFKNFVWEPFLKPTWEWIKGKAELMSEFGKELKSNFLYIRDFWAEKFENLRHFLFDTGEGTLSYKFSQFMDTLNNIWEKIKGVGSFLMDLPKIIFTDVVNGIIGAINNGIIKPLKSFVILKQQPFGGLNVIQPLDKPTLKPSTTKFLEGFNISKTGIPDMEQPVIPVIEAETVRGSMKGAMEAKMHSDRVLMEELKRLKEEKEAKETRQIQTMNQIQKSIITSTTESTRTIINNTKATGISINTNDRNNIDETPAGFDVMGAQYAF